MANLSDNAAKMAIVERLVKEGAIDFSEAILLLEKDIHYEYTPIHVQPWINPYNPYPFTYCTNAGATATAVTVTPVFASDSCRTVGYLNGMGEIIPSTFTAADLISYQAANTILASHN